MAFIRPEDYIRSNPRTNTQSGTMRFLFCSFLRRRSFNSRILMGRLIFSHPPPPIKSFQSTHSEECDLIFVALFLMSSCFNPRTPCGARHYRMIQVYHSMPFQSTHSEECDTAPIPGFRQLTHFNPRTPCGARHCIRVNDRRRIVSIHAPSAERDRAKES